MSNRGFDISIPVFESSSPRGFRRTILLEEASSLPAVRPRQRLDLARRSGCIEGSDSLAVRGCVSHTSGGAAGNAFRGQVFSKCVFALDVLLCPGCWGRRRIVGVYTGGERLARPAAPARV